MSVQVRAHRCTSRSAVAVGKFAISSTERPTGPCASATIFRACPCVRRIETSDNTTIVPCHVLLHMFCACCVKFKLGTRRPVQCHQRVLQQPRSPPPAGRTNAVSCRRHSAHSQYINPTCCAAYANSMQAAMHNKTHNRPLTAAKVLTAQLRCHCLQGIRGLEA